MGHARRTDHPRFRHDPESALLPDRAASETTARPNARRLGFDPDQPVGLVMFGGEGSTVMLEIVAQPGLRATGN